MSIFEVLDYRKALELLVQKLKFTRVNFSFQELAQEMRIQKSYLSKVIHGQAELNTDQLYLAAETLALNPDERDYLFLLLEMARTGVKKRREQLLEQAKKIQAQHLSSHQYLESKVIEPDTPEFGRYYLDPIHQVIHIALTIEKYRQDPLTLAHDLKISPLRLQGALQSLEQIGIIKQSKKGIAVLVDEIHLPPHSSYYRAWRLQIRALSQMRMHLGQDDRDYSFSVVFSADSETRTKVRAKFLEFLKDVEKFAKTAPTRSLYQMNFDLHGWTDED